MKIIQAKFQCIKHANRNQQNPYIHAIKSTYLISANLHIAYTISAHITYHIFPSSPPLFPLSISPSSLPHNASTCIQRLSQTSSSFMSNNGFDLIPGVARIELYTSLYFTLNSIIFFLAASLSNGLY